MKLIIKFLIGDEKTKLISQCIQQIISKTGDIFNVTSIVFDIKNITNTDLDENRAIITIDSNEEFIKNNDEKGIKYIILKSLFSLLVKKKLQKNINNKIMDILINREVSRNNFGYYVSYYYFHEIEKILISGKMDYFKINSSWLSFYGTDNYYYELFKDIALNVKGNEHHQKLNTFQCDLYIEENMEAALQTMREKT